MKTGTYTTPRGATVKVTQRPVPEGDGLKEWVITPTNEQPRYYHPKHPTMEQDFANLMAGLTMDGKPIKTTSYSLLRP